MSSTDIAERINVIVRCELPGAYWEVVEDRGERQLGLKHQVVGHSVRAYRGKIDSGSDDDIRWLVREARPWLFRED